jgi:hypothetical protein
MPDITTKQLADMLQDGTLVVEGAGAGRVLRVASAPNSFLSSDGGGDAVLVALAASRVLGRKATGDVAALTAAEVLAILDALTSAEVADAIAAALASYSTTAQVVLKSLFDAHSILYAASDDTPAALTVGASTLVGRLGAGGIGALTVAEVLELLGGAAPTGSGSLVRSVAPTLTKLTAAQYQVTPLATAYGAALNLDVAAANDHEIGSLTGHIALTLTNGIDGCSGTIMVKQAGPGSYTCSFAAAGRTVMRDTLTASIQPATAVGAVTLYAYYYATVGGTAYLIIAAACLVAA